MGQPCHLPPLLCPDPLPFWWAHFLGLSQPGSEPVPVLSILSILSTLPTLSISMHILRPALGDSLTPAVYSSKPHRTSSRPIAPTMPTMPTMSNRASASRCIVAGAALANGFHAAAIAPRGKS
ncbi:hypothetical protein EV356DRAFT_503263 [Viridothelium virens]|uniref:Uncharacterized protein n=1 Tax=Viridothelium virens TaxID=1048519 RepID=A0A6A6H780_VIRVR|nr:hypothetical protein EV356DRAFT_503263 [Viridothelium virens]